MSNIQTGAERMPHDLSHLGFLAGQIGRLVTISTTPVIAGDSFEMDAVGADRKSGSAGMPRPISYAVFCLKKKKSDSTAFTSSKTPRPTQPVGWVRQARKTGSHTGRVHEYGRS